MSTDIVCKNCGNSFQGKFCNQCGEKVYGNKDRSVIHLFGEVFHFITHFEGKFFTTLRTIVTRPGKMALDFTNGIRRKYFKPVSFFLLIVIIYLLSNLFSGLNMSFSVYLNPEYRYRTLALPVVKQKLRSHPLTADQLANKYNAKSPVFAKLLLFLLIPLSAMVIYLLYIRSAKYFFDHLVFSVEIMSMYLVIWWLLFPAIILSVMYLIPSIRPFIHDDSWVYKVLAIFLGSYFFIAFRNFYREKIWLTLLKTLIFLATFVLVILFIYRIILFYTVMFFI
jgi:hypothetical protein